jgi:Family of unknown function (DUF6326)
MMTKIEPKVLLSTLWIFATLNYLYCDLMGLMDSSLLKQYLTGKVDGLIIDEGFLLLAAFLMEIPIGMVLLARIFAHRPNRWANLFASFIKTGVMITTLFVGTPTSYYLFFALIEIATTLFIGYFAWQWTDGESIQQSTSPV